MATSREQSAEIAGLTSEGVKELLVALRTQNHTMIKQGQEVLEYLDRLATDTEKAAARAFWIALPIYVGIGLAIAGFVLVLVGSMLRTL